MPESKKQIDGVDISAELGIWKYQVRTLEPITYAGVSISVFTLVMNLNQYCWNFSYIFLQDIFRFPNC